MFSNFPGVVKCLQNDFKYFCDPQFLGVFAVPAYLQTVEGKLESNLIVNTFYNFIFNHESPGHTFLAEKEKWPGGKWHFVRNNFEAFRKQYLARIENMRNYMSNPDVVVDFVIARWGQAGRMLILFI